MDPRNFVTQFRDANTPLQSNLERFDLGNRLAGSDASEHYIYYRVTPDYAGSCAVPYQMRVQAMGESAALWTLQPRQNGVAGGFLAGWLRGEYDLFGPNDKLVPDSSGLFAFKQPP